MMKHIHILPVTVAVLVLIFGLKLNAVWTEAQGFLFDVAVSEVQANEAKSEPAAEHGAKSPEEQNSAVSTEKPIEAAPIIAGVATAGKEFSTSEVKVLERLSDRRAELDRRNQELDMRDNLLKATESRIDEKITKLKEMETTLNDLLKLHDDQETAQLDSLVKIYEKMKPKDAARIFNNLEMDILIDVASKIKEAKMASILAAMNSQQANKLTVELATRRSLPEVDNTKS
ncbi:MotE family protein [Sneathiella sp.]|uniref:MotE family protein n=1 Tax=Sneathiella sp. TaxID=1964365 RepID=UPI003565633D